MERDTITMETTFLMKCIEIDQIRINIIHRTIHLKCIDKEITITIIHAITFLIKCIVKGVITKVIQATLLTKCLNLNINVTLNIMTLQTKCIYQGMNSTNSIKLNLMTTVEVYHLNKTIIHSVQGMLTTLIT